MANALAYVRRSNPTKSKEEARIIVCNCNLRTKEERNVEMKNIFVTKTNCL
jgi:hypothetical protein